MSNTCETCKHWVNVTYTTKALEVGAGPSKLQSQ